VRSAAHISLDVVDVLSEKHKIKRNNNISSNDTQDIIQQLPQ
jgi:hypothetical protein